MKQKSPSDIAVPAIVKAELYYGANRSIKKQKIIRALDVFLSPFSILSFDGKAALHYAEIRADLEKRGEIIGPNDLIIAACAIARGCILITHNVKEFKKVSGLKVEDWTE